MTRHPQSLCHTQARSRWTLVVWSAVATMVIADRLAAQVTVVANLTRSDITFAVRTSTADVKVVDNSTADHVTYQLPPGDVTAVWVGKGAELRETPARGTDISGGTAKKSSTGLQDPEEQDSKEFASYQVAPGGVYYWADGEQRRALHSIELGELDPVAYPGVAEVTELTVKILVDDDERTVRAHWHRVLQSRVEAASRILERTCRVRLRVVAFDQWETPMETAGLRDGIAAFERLVDPAPAQVAIGFASQYRVLDAETPHLGVIRGALGRHMLIREQAGRLSEPEKLEILVHELGHYFGAVHIVHKRSVMRSRLGDGQARLRRFRIVYDPINALIMNHYVTELHAGRKPATFHPAVAARVQQLKQILSAIERQAGIAERAEANRRMSPERVAPQGMDAPRRSDPNLEREAGDSSPSEPRVEEGQPASLSAVERAVVALLAEFRVEPPAGATGNVLTEWYVKRLARAAQDLPADVAPRAFLIALGIGFDDSRLLREAPIVGTSIRRLETDEQRTARLSHVRGIALDGRHDWALHFFVSAMLAAQYGERAAAMAGLLKEIRDAHGGSGFDKTDLAADRAGVAWAAKILSRRLLLLELAEAYRNPRIRRRRGRR